MTIVYSGNPLIPRNYKSQVVCSRWSTFESADDVLKYDHPNERYCKLLSDYGVPWLGRN